MSDRAGPGWGVEHRGGWRPWPWTTRSRSPTRSVQRPPAPDRTFRRDGRGGRDRARPAGWRAVRPGPRPGQSPPGRPAGRGVGRRVDRRGPQSPTPRCTWLASSARPVRPAAVRRPIETTASATRRFPLLGGSVSPGPAASRPVGGYAAVAGLALVVQAPRSRGCPEPPDESVRGLRPARGRPGRPGLPHHEPQSRPPGGTRRGSSRQAERDAGSSRQAERAPRNAPIPDAAGPGLCSTWAGPSPRRRGGARPRPASSPAAPATRYTAPLPPRSGPPLRDTAPHRLYRADPDAPRAVRGPVGGASRHRRSRVGRVPASPTRYRWATPSPEKARLRRHGTRGTGSRRSRGSRTRRDGRRLARFRPGPGSGPGRRAVPTGDGRGGPGPCRSSLAAAGRRRGGAGENRAGLPFVCLRPGCPGQGAIDNTRC